MKESIRNEESSLLSSHKRNASLGLNIPALNYSQNSKYRSSFHNMDFNDLNNKNRFTDNIQLQVLTQHNNKTHRVSKVSSLSQISSRDVSPVQITTKRGSNQGQLLLPLTRQTSKMLASNGLLENKRFSQDYPNLNGFNIKDISAIGLAEGTPETNTKANKISSKSKLLEEEEENTSRVQFLNKNSFQSKFLKEQSHSQYQQQAANTSQIIKSRRASGLSFYNHSSILGGYSSHEEAVNRKKVFYSLKNAITRDNQNKLQEFTIQQKQRIAEDIQTNFIPKIYNSNRGSSVDRVESLRDGEIRQQKIKRGVQEKSMQIRSQSNEQSSLQQQKKNNNQIDESCESPSVINSSGSGSNASGTGRGNQLSKQFKKMAFIYQADPVAVDKGIDQKLLMVIKIIDSRAKILKDLKNFNLESTIHSKNQSFKQQEEKKNCIEYDDIELMGDVISAIGEVYVMFGDMQSALNTFNAVRMLADQTQNFSCKVQCLESMSAITKKLKMYHYSLRLIKKALQYVWEVNDLDKEIHLYEEIGLIYFHLSDIQKASLFHQRAMNGGVEYQDSSQRIQSRKSLHYFLSQLDPKIDTLDRQILVKIPALPFSFIPLKESEEMPPHVRNPFMLKQKMKLVIDINGFKSEYSEQYQLDNIFISDEFSSEISTPRNDSQLNRFAMSEDEIVVGMQIDELDPEISRKKGSSSRLLSNLTERSAINSALAQQTSSKFIPPKHLMKKSENTTTFYLSEGMKKKSLEDKIRDRVIELQLWEKRGMLSKLMSNPYNKKNLASTSKPIQINHLGVNRNIDNFDHSQNVSIAKSNLFFNKIIAAQYQKNTDLHL